MLVLDDATLRAFAAKPNMVAHFPELRQLKNKTTCCDDSSAMQSMATLRRAMACLSEPRVNKLKELTGADTIVIRFDKNGKIQEKRY